MGYRVYRYGATHGIYTSHPFADRIKATIISGGGPGMGSRPNMNFSATDLPYAMYGQKGGAACWDTLPSKHICTCDGQTFKWPNHGLVADQPVFFSGDQAALFYVHGPSITADTVKFSAYPYAAPGVTTPYIPYVWPASTQLEATAYLYAALGGNAGGVIGDQAIPGSAIFPPDNRAKYWYGGCGQNVIGAGGSGGALSSGVGVVQIGGGDGNPGMNLQGEGGSGAGYMNPDGTYPTTWGPGGGAGGTKLEIECVLKPQYYFHAGPAAEGGPAGSGGFKGGAGSLPLVQVEEWFPDEVEE